MGAGPVHEKRTLALYLAWVEAWCSVREAQATSPVLTSMTLDEVCQIFREKDTRLPSLETIESAVIVFREQFKQGRITLGGSRPPSNNQINLLSENYDPRTPCECCGIGPTCASFDTDFETLAQNCRCNAIQKMLELVRLIGDKPDQWNGHGILTQQALEKAAVELALSNTEWQKPIDCHPGSCKSLPNVFAPDRRPNPHCDTPADVHHAMYPTFEHIKLCADAKYYYSIACGGSLCDEGISRALADMGNDILIADYCEAANEEKIALLQKTGAAAVSFLRLCNMAGFIADWQFNVVAASVLQFRATGYYRDHAHPRLPQGLFGSRQTGNSVHRHIDLGFMVEIVCSSLGTGETFDKHVYFDIVEACALLNDLVDFRSDTTRRQRENIVLRGIRKSVCRSLNDQIYRCYQKVLVNVRKQKVSALVIMAFCNWCILGSHHKIFELLRGFTVNPENPPCKYDGLELYDQLVEALIPYGTLREHGPRLDMTRADLDKLYCLYRADSETHIAWLADSTRILLDPRHCRPIVDAIHFEWNGSIGDLNYCP
ncbi:uncharacterized protein N7498_006181 [Penicillium cinerascens]|uniref:Uncharacterized protein n=1 Tax=Penicillium cinerascens TaxID=70096 RepID=A0A9W9MHP2_9EURO|nr:uncharacterized protein N7498_006181 [Penicillium cinerascens]KAJ5201518.1 hypothetical protein N7498_006181 [Penicillium cinerascens]